MSAIEISMDGIPPLGDMAERGEEGASAASSRLEAENYQIIDYFRSCTDKGMLLSGFLRLVHPLFATVALFSVQPKGMKYLNGHGPQLQAPHLLQQPIAWREGILIRRTILQRMPYQGAIPVDLEEKQMFEQFLQVLPLQCWLYPAAIGDGVDCLIYADSPHLAPHMATQRFEFVIGKMVLALRRLLVEHLLVHG